MLGATAALATAACTSRERAIVPYTKRPLEIVPGIANYYASTFSEGYRSYAVLVKTREGRPIHLTGNDEHPRLKGKTSPRAIADLASIYDPDRVRAPQLDQRPTTWVAAETALLAAVAAAKRDGKGVLLITGASDSPSRHALLAQLKANLPTLDILHWEPAVSDSAVSAAKSLYGTDVVVVPHLAEADIIVSLGADFLNGDDPSAIAEFTAKRRPAQSVSAMSRLWVLEGTMTLTGANADQRVLVRPSRMAALAFALVRELHEKHAVPLPAGVTLPQIPDGLIASLGIANDVWEKLVRRFSSGAAIRSGAVRRRNARISARGNASTQHNAQVSGVSHRQGDQPCQLGRPAVGTQSHGHWALHCRDSVGCQSRLRVPGSRPMARCVRQSDDSGVVRPNWR